ncbi:hypothetical protein ACJX0J_036389, partial [Zea mays]
CASGVLFSFNDSDYSCLCCGVEIKIRSIFLSTTTMWDGLGILAKNITIFIFNIFLTVINTNFIHVTISKILWDIDVKAYSIDKYKL